MRRAIGLWVMAIGCALVAPSGCFAVEAIPACDDTTGLFERSHVCMPLGIEVTLPGAPWQLRRAVFDGDGIDDLAVGVGTDDARSVFAVTELGGAGKQTLVVSSPGLHDFVPSFVFGDASGVHDLVTVIETGDQLEGGALTIHAHGGDLFASGDPLVFALKGNLLGVPCVRPVSLAAVGDGIGPDYYWGVACESPAMPMAAADLGYLTTPIIEGGGVFEAYGDPRYSNSHAMVAARLTDGPIPSIAFAAVPTDGDSDIIGLAYENDDMVRPSESVVEPGQGLISRIYAADLDGDGVEEFVALHPKGDLITISRRVKEDPPTYEALDQEVYAGYFAVPSPLAAAFGDFTGDGEIDIAVAFDTEDGGTGVGIYIRWPDQGEGSFYASLGALKGFAADEPVVDLVALAADDDDKPDLAVAQVTGAGGRVQVFLNRSLKPG